MYFSNQQKIQFRQNVSYDFGVFTRWNALYAVGYIPYKQYYWNFKTETTVNGLQTSSFILLFITQEQHIPGTINSR